jgi:magnesium transporter
MAVTVLVARPDGSLLTDVPLGDLKPHLDDEACRIWVDFLEPGMEDYEALQTLFGFHHLALEDCHNRIQRPKVDEYKGHVFVVFHGLNLNEGADPLDMLELDAFISPRYLVTIRYGRLFSIREVMERARKNPDLLLRGTDYVYYAIVDRMVEYYFDLMDRLDGQVDEIEERLFHELGEQILQEIMELKRRVMELRRVAGPQREVMNQIARGDYPVIGENTRFYFRDVYDHLLRIGDALEGYRDMIGSAMDTYMSQLSNRTNEIMKVLSVIATIMLPLSLITGFFGMNFVVMPGLKSPTGVYWLIGGMVALAGGMMLYFKRRGWF